MKTCLLAALTAGLLVAGTHAQITSLQMTTQGVVPRIGQPNIPNCSTAPEPYYFIVNGTFQGSLAPNEELRLIVRPTLLNGGPVFGCEWITQCQRANILPGNNIQAVAQFGTNNQPRSWGQGLSADMQWIVVDRNAGVGVCIANPISVSLVRSNVTNIVIDPAIPTLYDFFGPCSNSRHDVTGVPAVGNNLDYQLPGQGFVCFGLIDPNGFVFGGCSIYLQLIPAISAFSTDATGFLQVPIPFNPSLAGVDVNTQGVLITPNGLDWTQPTHISIR